MSQLTEARRQKEAFFKHDPQSPLTPEQRKTFEGLKYYPENPALRIITPIEEYDDKQPVTTITSTGSARISQGRAILIYSGWAVSDAASLSRP